MISFVPMPRRYHWFLATVTTVLTSVLLAWLHANPTAAGMVFLVLVVWTSTQTGIALALYTAILCGFCFDFFFLPPVRTFRLAGPQEWVEMASFVASCIVVGRVAEAARRQARKAEQRREDVERLYELSQQMMLHEDPAGLVHVVPRLIDRIFALKSVVLYVRDQDQFYASTSQLPPGIEASLRAMANGPNPTLTVPESYSAMPLMLGLRPVGALGWQPGSLSREMATAVSAQVAIVLTRALAIEASTRLEAAREGERLRTALIDSLTHELRTPLTAIRAAATTLRQGDGLDDAGREDLVALVDEESLHLDELIGEAVEMAEIDAQVMQIQIAPRYARDLLDQALEESRKTLAHHRVTVDVEEEGKPAWFDAHLLGRVLRHLLENAARYSPAGSRVTLRARRVAGKLEFIVEDSGSGIDAADMPLIFEKFYRGKKGSKLGKGSGMGLAICKAIVTAHGGAIQAQNVPGQGAIFVFWVPLVEKEPGAGG